MAVNNDRISCQSIPWNQPNSWQQAQHSIELHLNRHRDVLDDLFQLAGKIDNQLQALGLQMETLCADTCNFCPDPCCLTASVWYDLRDLLGLHLMQKPIPIGQPISEYRSGCRYITNTGCSLPRAIRPWICTWYLCPVQMRRLRNQPGNLGKSLLLNREEIKIRRGELEKRFLAVVC